MKKRFLGVLLTACMLVASMSACANKDVKVEEPKKVEETQKEVAMDDGKTIVYWSMWEATEPQGIALQKAIDSYVEETGIKVDVQFKGRKGQREGLKAALDAGAKIDIFDEDIDRVNGTWAEYLLDLEDLAKATNYEETANKGLMAAVREVADGTLKSIPYQPNIFAFFYNKDLFMEAGIEKEPKTWEEFLEVCQKLKDKDITPITCDDAYSDCMIGYHLGRLGGEAKVREIVLEGKWDDPIVMQLAKDYEELAKRGFFSPNIGSNVWPTGQNTELALGEVAMYLNGSWLPNEVVGVAGEDFNWGCFSYPAVTNGAIATATGTDASNFGAQVFGINKNSDVSKEAFDLIVKMTKGEFDKELAMMSNGIPADSQNADWPKLVLPVKPVLDDAKVRFTWAVGIESNTDMTPIIKENFIKLMAGTINAEEFVKAMKEAANK